MQVLVRQAIEPGSYASEKTNAILADNAVSDRLRRILRRYLAGELTGRSFLISGHRGVGKTTLVRRVVQDVEKEIKVLSASPDAPAQQRPLLVVLPGPMLLPPGQSGGEAEAGAVLQFITVNLYRALARYFANRYEEIASTTAHCELASAFRVKLDGYVSLAELRGFWTAVGALHTGIVSPRPPSQLSQGPREIAALWSCLRAYLSLSADYEEAAGGRDDMQAKTEAALKAAPDKSLMQALSAVAAGSLAGAGSAAAGQSHLFTLFASLGVAAGSALLLSLSASRSRTSSDSLESKIRLKRDLKTLTRELPELIMRCRDAGVVPVFLIDELDKVERLEQRMESLVRNIKFFVTEQALFFFVTDRTYYEYLEALSRDTVYPREHTFFSQRLFVAYQPEDWRKYILELIEAPADPDGRFVAEALSFILLCRSRMHAIDLRREIAKITYSSATLARPDIESEIRPEHLNVTQTRAQMEILMQVAVEVTYFEDPDLAGRCAGEPPFTQIVYDALYYPARHWAKNPAMPFTLDRAEFEIYLSERSKFMMYEGARDDLDFLYRKVRRVLNWLANPALLDEAMAVEGAAGKFADSIRSCIRSSPPLAARAGDSLRWRYDVYGRTMTPSRVEDVLENSELWALADTIPAVQDKLASATRATLLLGAIQQAGLMDPVPSVTDVFDSIRRLNGLRGVQSPAGYREMDADAENVIRFGNDLRLRTAAIAQLVVSCIRLSQYLGYTPPQALDYAWTTLCDRLGRDMTLEQMLERTSRAFSALVSLPPGDSHPPGGDNFDIGKWSAWLDTAIAAASQLLQPHPMQAQFEAAAWKDCSLDGAAWLAGKPVDRDRRGGADLERLVCSLNGWGPGKTLRQDLAAVASAEWSALAIDPASPLWARVMALIALGQEQAAANLERSAAARPGEGIEEQPEPLPRLIRERLAEQRLQKLNILALYSDPQGVVRTWLPAPGHSILVLTPFEWNSIVGTLHETTNPYGFPDSLLYPSPAYFLYEPNPAEVRALTIPRDLIPWKDGGSLRESRCGLITTQASAVGLGEGPVVVMPKTPTEAIEKLSLLRPWNPFTPAPAASVKPPA